MVNRSPPGPSAAEAVLAQFKNSEAALDQGQAPVTPEDQRLVLALASAYGQGKDPTVAAAAIAAAAARISSWAGVERLLRVHRCSALAYHLFNVPEVRTACQPPDATLHVLQRRYLASFARATVDPPVLRQLLAEIVGAGVPALVIKGLTLGTWLYGDPALREYDDFDFVIPEAKAEVIHRLLIDRGFMCFIDPFLRPRLSPNQTLEAASYQGGNGVVVDIRYNPWRSFWRPDPARGDPFDGLWERRCEVFIAGLAVPTFGLEDQFLHLARHLQEHDYFRAIWFVDVMLLLRHHGDCLDWDQIGREARLHGIHGGVYRTLEVLDRVFRFRAPDAGWAVLRPTALERHLHRRVWPDSLAKKTEHPSLLKNPMGPHHIRLRGLLEPRQVGGLALLLLDRNRVQSVNHLVRQRFPPRKWLEAVYGEGSAKPDSYLSLWRRHRRQHRRAHPS